MSMVMDEGECALMCRPGCMIADRMGLAESQSRRIWGGKTTETVADYLNLTYIDYGLDFRVRPIVW